MARHILQQIAIKHTARRVAVVRNDSAHMRPAWNHGLFGLVPKVGTLPFLSCSTRGSFFVSLYELSSSFECRRNGPHQRATAGTTL